MTDNTQTTNNILKSTNIYGGLAILNNPSGSLGRLYIHSDAKIDGKLVVNNRLIDALFLDSLATSTSVDDKITVAMQNSTQQANSYTDTKIATLVGTADASLDSIQELATAIQANSSLVDGIYSTIGSKTTLSEVQSYLGYNYYDKSNVDTKLAQTLSSSQAFTSQSLAPITTELNNVKSGLNLKITTQDMQNYVTQNYYNKSYIDNQFISTLSQANQYTNTAIQNITGYETTTNVNTKIEQLQLQVNQKAPINNPSFTGTVSGVTKAMVGLGNVSDISPLNMPISTATQSALDLKASISALDLKANVNNPTFTGNLSIPNGDITSRDITARDITARAVTLTGNISMPNNTITAKDMYSSNLLLQGDNVNGYIRATNTNSTLYLGANNENLISVTKNSTSFATSTTFSKGMVITDTASNLNISLRTTGRTSQLNFVGGANVGNYNPVTADSDSLIVYHNGAKDTGALNIVNWSDGANGIKLTKQTTKVYNNLEANGSITMDNSSVSNRVMSGIGQLRFTDITLTNSQEQSLTILQSGVHAYFTNNRPLGTIQFLGKDSTAAITNRLIIQPFAEVNNANPTTKADDLVVYADGLGTNQSLNLTVSSSTKTGVRIEPLGTTLTGGDNYVNVSSNNGTTINGNLNVNNYDISARSMNLSNDLTASNITVTNSATIGNFIAGDEFQKLTNQHYYAGNVSSLNQVSGTGVTNVQGFSVVIPPNFRKQFTVYIPISHSRTFDTNSTGTISETVNSITCTIFKNGVVWNTPFSYSLSTFIGASFTQTFTVRASGFFLQYDSFIGTATVIFTPDISSTTDTYSVNFTYSGSVSSTFLFSTRARGIITNTSTSGISVSSTTNISTSVVNAITTGYRNPSNSIEYILPSTNSNGTITELENDVTANSIISQSINTKTLIAPVGIACFLFDGSTTFTVWPFCCSMKGLNPQGADDYWVVNAGYSIYIYSANNYTGNVYALDNTYGTAPQRYASSPANNARSIRVFFKYSEIVFSGISS